MADGAAQPADTSKKAGDALTPAMRQYQQFKAQYPQYILFFRMGDFYEMFWEDARTANRVLGVTLTSRSRGGLDAEDAIPMAGVPFHAVDSYLRRMIAAGYKVAICEQMEDPAAAKGVIRRDVTRLMTPGTLTDEPLLESGADNFLAAVAFAVTRSGGYRAGLAWVELSTGHCRATSGSEAQILEQLARLSPAEVLVPELATGQPHDVSKRLAAAGMKSVTPRPGWQFTPHHAREEIARQWKVATAAGFGFEDDDPALQAAAAVLSYLAETQKSSLEHLRPLQRHIVEAHLAIDPATWRSLEVERTVRSGGTEGSLFAAIKRTLTAMGTRLLRQWLRSPLRDVTAIRARQDAVAGLIESPAVLKPVRQALENTCDIERVLARLSVNRAFPRDVAALGKCLASMPQLLALLRGLPRPDETSAALLATEDFCREQAAYINAAIQPEPAQHLREGGVIAEGFDAELDRLRSIESDSTKWLREYQARLIGESGIATLKVGYNKVFGFYIEVTDAHRDKVPANWTRKQTVKNAERYITQELKGFENDTLTARDRAITLEQTLFEKVRQTLLPLTAQFQSLADALARLDVLASLALLAIDRRYCRPDLADSRVFEIVDGRHPVLEQQLGSEFVANDVKLGEDDSLLLITGPNMAGKSTYIRQVALIAILAHIGSFVPAKSATIGAVDRLYARIGASDEIHAGQSTFMVEMVETANILNNATDRSLVVLDEIGRGTSTLDGLSLAWSLAEYIASTLRCRTLFATHYHELTELAERFKGVRNLNVAVREWEDEVIFLHRIVEGGTDRSYGIHVARLAGVPQPVLARARQLLSELAVHHVGTRNAPKSRRREENTLQLQLFSDPSELIARELRALDLNALTPMQAFDTLRKLKESAGAG
jgi:DNA mismatch repair protein MutS